MDKYKKENKSISLKSNALWNILGSLVYSLSQWGLIVVIAKVSSLEMLGIFSLALALTAPFVMLLRFNLRVAVASDIKDDFNYDEYFVFRTLTTIVFFISMTLITIIYPIDFYTSLIVISLALGKVFESMSDVIYGDWQKRERLDLVAKSRIIKGVSSFLLFSIVMFSTNNLLIATLTLSLVWLITLILYDNKILSNYRKISFKINRNRQFMILRLTLPLGLAQLLASLNANIPIYFIESFHSLEMVGIFSALIYIIVAGNNLILAISNVLISRLSIYYNEKKIKKYIKLLILPCLSLFLLGIFGLVIIYYCGEYLLAIVYSDIYSEYKTEFLIMCLMGLIKYLNIFLDAGISATRNFKIMPVINAMTMVMIILTGSYLIFQYGLIGAVYSLIIAEFTQLIIRFIILSKILNKKSKESGVGLSL